MSEELDQEDEVDWKAIVELLREGKTAEIPCVKERDYVRRTTQVVKRAEKKGIAVEVLRGEGVLRMRASPERWWQCHGTKRGKRRGFSRRATARAPGASRSAPSRARGRAKPGRLTARRLPETSIRGFDLPRCPRSDRRGVLSVAGTSISSISPGAF